MDLCAKDRITGHGEETAIMTMIVVTVTMLCQRWGWPCCVGDDGACGGGDAGVGFFFNKHMLVLGMTKQVDSTHFGQP